MDSYPFLFHLRARPFYHFSLVSCHFKFFSLLNVWNIRTMSDMWGSTTCFIRGSASVSAMSSWRPVEPVGANKPVLGTVGVFSQLTSWMCLGWCPPMVSFLESEVKQMDEEWYQRSMVSIIGEKCPCITHSKKLHVLFSTFCADLFKGNRFKLRSTQFRYLNITTNEILLVYSSNPKRITQTCIITTHLFSLVLGKIYFSHNEYERNV